MSKQFSSLDEVASSFTSWAGSELSDTSSRDVLFGYLNTLGMTGYISSQALQAGEAGAFALALGWLKTLDKIVSSDSSYVSSGVLSGFSIPISSSTLYSPMSNLPSNYFLVASAWSVSSSYTFATSYVSSLDSLSFNISDVGGSAPAYNGSAASVYNYSYKLIVYTSSPFYISRSNSGSTYDFNNSSKSAICRFYFDANKNLIGSLSSSGFSACITSAALSALGGTFDASTHSSLLPDAINTGASDAQSQAIDGYFENQDADALKDALIDVLGSQDVSALSTNPDVLSPSTSESQVTSKPAGGLVIGGSDWAGSIVTGVRAGSVSLDAAIDAVLSALQAGVLSLSDAMALLATIAGAEVAALVTGFDGWTWENYTYELKSLKWASCFPLCLYWDCLEMFENLSATSGGWDYKIEWDTTLAAFGGEPVVFDVSDAKLLAPYIKTCWIALAAVGFMFWFASTFVGVAIGADKKAEKDEKKTSKGGGD